MRGVGETEAYCIDENGDDNGAKLKAHQGRTLGQYEGSAVRLVEAETESKVTASGET